MSSLPVPSHRTPDNAWPMSTMTDTKDCMKHLIYSKEVEQPYIIIILTQGGAIRRVGPKPPTVHGRLERISITLWKDGPASEPQTETAYTAPPFLARGRKKRKLIVLRNLDNEDASNNFNLSITLIGII